MGETRYTKSHEWCSLQGGVAVCGISKHAADELNDLTFLDFRVAPGAKLTQGQVFGEIDSVKATSELYAPVAGTVEAINETFKSADELPTITKSPEKDGWLIKIKPSDPKQVDALMSAAAYAEFCASGGGH